MKIFKQSAEKEKHDFLFNLDLIEPLLIAQWDIRSESEYDQDETPELTALTLLKAIINKFGENVYLILAGQDIAPRNNLRTYKGIVRNNISLKNLNSRNFEVANHEGKTRLGSVVKLNRFSHRNTDSFILDWISGVIVISSLEIDELSDYAKQWLATNKKSFLGFDYEEVAKSLIDLQSTAVLRYFPADNGRSEQVAILSNQVFFQNTVQNIVLTAIRKVIK